MNTELPRPIFAAQFGDMRDGDVIVMEYAAHGSLGDYVASSQERLAPSIARRILEPIFRTLKVLHDNNVAHRDIKPGNVLVDLRLGTMRLLLADFGTAKAESSAWAMRQCRTRAGTPDYMSRQVKEGRKYDGKKADVYSLAVTSLQLYAGEMCNVAEVFGDEDAIVFADLLVNMTADRERDRYTIDEALAHPWFGREKASDAEVVAEVRRRWAAVECARGVASEGKVIATPLDGVSKIAPVDTAPTIVARAGGGGAGGAVSGAAVADDDDAIDVYAMRSAPAKRAGRNPAASLFDLKDSILDDEDEISAAVTRSHPASAPTTTTKRVPDRAHKLRGSAFTYQCARPTLTADQIEEAVVRITRGVADDTTTSIRVPLDGGEEVLVSLVVEATKVRLTAYDWSSNVDRSEVHHLLSSIVAQLAKRA